MTVDIHTHVVPRRLPDMADRPGGAHFPSVANVTDERADVIVDGAVMRVVPSVSWDASRRLAAMDEAGVTRQVLSPMPALLTYWAAIDDARYYTDAVNDAIAELAAAAPDRFVGFGALPMQDPRAAIDAVPRLVELGLRGVELGSNIEGRSVGDPSFVDVFREIADAGLAVFVHSTNPVGADRLVGFRGLDNLVGFPVDIGLTAMSVITGGLLHAVPELRMAFSHGGGALAMLLPRLRMGWQRFGTDATKMPVDPEVVARSLWFDTLVYDPRALRYLIELVGQDALVVGSDFPFVVMENPPGAVLAAPELAGAFTEQALREGNARRFLGEA